MLDEDVPVVNEMVGQNHMISQQIVNKKTDIEQEPDLHRLEMIFLKIVMKANTLMVTIQT